MAAGFVYKNGMISSTGTLQNLCINDSGQMGSQAYNSVTGITQGYIVSASGHATNIGSFGGTLTQPNAINQSGELAGISYNAAGYQNAFLYSNGILENLGTLDGMNSSAAFGLNDYGDVVGESYQSDVGDLAFLYTESGGMQDLNDLIPSGSGWTLDSARGINDAGQITGIGLNPEGEAHAFLLDPVPEPSTACLLAAVAFVGAIAIRGNFGPIWFMFNRK